VSLVDSQVTRYAVAGCVAVVAASNVFCLVDTTFCWFLIRARRASVLLVPDPGQVGQCLLAEIFTHELNSRFRVLWQACALLKESAQYVMFVLSCIF